MSAPRLAMSSQRIGTFADLPALLREQGVDPGPVFVGSGLDPAAITPDTLAPLEVLVAVLDRSVDATGCAHLGLLLGLRFTMDTHGPIGRLMRTAPTLRDALADHASWQHGYSTGAIVYLARLGDDYAFGFGVHVPQSMVSHGVYDFVTGVAVRMVSELTGGRVQPVEVHLSRRAPEPASPYARLVRYPLVFNRPLNCVILDSASLATPLPTHDPVARRALLATMEAQVAAVSGHAGPVRRAIRRALLEEAPRMPAIAESLGIHPRTLRRRLTQEGTTFDRLVDEVRMAVARELIELTDMPMSEIGDALAFASPGVFTVWFRRAFGTPPSVWPRRKPREAAGI